MNQYRNDAIVFIAYSGRKARRSSNFQVDSFQLLRPLITGNTKLFAVLSGFGILVYAIFFKHLTIKN